MTASRSGLRFAAVVSAACAAAIAVGGCHAPEKPAAAPSAAIPGPLAGVTVILDPGHGGEDTGAIRGGVREATVNYRMAALLATLLRARGAHVVFTVTSAALVDPAVPHGSEQPLLFPRDARLVWNGEPVRLRAAEAPDDLYRRAAIVRNVVAAQPRRGTDRRILFLAMHCDDLGGASGRGARVYYDRRSGGPCRLALILKRRLTAAGLTNSPGGRVIPRSYGVLNPQYNPAPEAALVEMATLTDPRDRHAVRDPAWRRRVVGILADSIQECCGATVTADATLGRR